MNNYQRLERSLIDLIHEQQLKLGYRKETVRLYFPLTSLAHLLDAPPEKEHIRTLLKEYFEKNQDRLGDVRISCKGDTVCLIFPEEAAEYVHLHAGKDPFLEAFISEIAPPDCSFRHLCELFRRFSGQVCVRRMTGEEFDYLFYFKDGIPNDYRYCVTFEEEDHHTVYHRFIPEDFEEYHFSEGEDVEI